MVAERSNPVTAERICFTIWDLVLPDHSPTLVGGPANKGAGDLIAQPRTHGLRPWFTNKTNHLISPSNKAFCSASGLLSHDPYTGRNLPGTSP